MGKRVFTFKNAYIIVAKSIHSFISIRINTTSSPMLAQKHKKKKKSVKATVTPKHTGMRQ